MDTPQQIRVAALRLFASHGFEGTSLQAIADVVGVTKQTLLYHYPSKEALRRAVLDDLFAHWRERLPRVFEAVTSGHRRFEALTAELIAFFGSETKRARLLVRELLDHPVEMRQLLVENLRPWILLVSQYIKEGQRAGLIHDDVDPEAYVLNVIVLVVAALSSHGVLTTVLVGQDAAKEDTKEQIKARQVRELSRLTRTALFVTPGIPAAGSQPSGPASRPIGGHP